MIGKVLIRSVCYECNESVAVGPGNEPARCERCHAALCPWHLLLHRTNGCPEHKAPGSVSVGGRRVGLLKIARAEEEPAPPRAGTVAANEQTPGLDQR